MESLKRGDASPPTHLFELEVKLEDTLQMWEISQVTGQGHVRHMRETSRERSRGVWKG